MQIIILNGVITTQPQITVGKKETLCFKLSCQDSISKNEFQHYTCYCPFEINIQVGDEILLVGYLSPAIRKDNNGEVMMSSRVYVIGIHIIQHPNSEPNDL